MLYRQNPDGSQILIHKRIIILNKKQNLFLRLGADGIVSWHDTVFPVTTFKDIEEARLVAKNKKVLGHIFEMTEAGREISYRHLEEIKPCEKTKLEIFKKAFDGYYFRVSEFTIKKILDGIVGEK